MPKKHIAIIGSGPAGLMAATILSESGFQVTLYDKRRGPGFKLLVAGKSGLNVSHHCSFQDLVDSYIGPSDHFEAIFKSFSPEDWLKFIESLGLETFTGTSNRVFLQDMKAGQILKLWTTKLKNSGVTFIFDYRLTDFKCKNDHVLLTFNENKSASYDAAILALGGGSWSIDNPVKWPAIFERKRIPFEEFKSSNAGLNISWPKKLLDEADREPLKNIKLSYDHQSHMGDLLITDYGLEGTPAYNLRFPKTVTIDLKPDLEKTEILEKLNSSKENLSPIRRIKKHLNLSHGSLAILFHMSTDEEKNSLDALISKLKALTLEVNGTQPLIKAISSSGGVSFTALDNNLQLRNCKNLYCAGEMIAWDTPTGGFLIQACVSEGAFVAKKIAGLA